MCAKGKGERFLYLFASLKFVIAVRVNMECIISIRWL
jgi:hypothetical protein